MIIIIDNIISRELSNFAISNIEEFFNMDDFLRIVDFLKMSNFLNLGDKVSWLRQEITDMHFREF